MSDPNIAKIIIEGQAEFAKIIVETNAEFATTIIDTMGKLHQVRLVADVCIFTLLLILLVVVITRRVRVRINE